MGSSQSYAKFLLKYWYYVVLTVVISLAVSIFVNFLGIVIIIIAVGVSRQFFENDLFKAFARANQFDYQKGSAGLGQTGFIFSIGHSQFYKDVVSGTYQKLPLLLFMFHYTIGYGRNSHTYDRAVMAINFNTLLPAFVLRRHRKFQLLEEERESLKSYNYTEKINLEGDFADHFQVYIRPGTQVDVLTILTPDVMQILVNLDKYEIEMTSDGSFCVYCHGLITKTRSLIEMYQIVEVVSQKLARDANRAQVILKDTQAVQNSIVVAPGTP